MLHRVHDVLTVILVSHIYGHGQDTIMRMFLKGIHKECILDITHNSYVNMRANACQGDTGLPILRRRMTNHGLLDGRLQTRGGVNLYLGIVFPPLASLPVVYVLHREIGHFSMTHDRCGYPA